MSEIEALRFWIMDLPFMSGNAVNAEKCNGAGRRDERLPAGMLGWLLLQLPVSGEDKSAMLEAARKRIRDEQGWLYLPYPDRVGVYRRRNAGNGRASKS